MHADLRSSIAVAAFLLGVSGGALPQYANAEGIANRTIGFVMTNKAWAVYQTPGAKEECPNGFNDGPREQFKKLYPDDGKQRTLAETQFAREADTWFPADKDPSTDKGPLPFFEVVGKTAIGLNLDGKVGPHDFTGPHGEPGIDNQLYRVIGCVAAFRGPDGPYTFFQNNYMQLNNFNRVLVEITNVDDLTNDNDVTVTFYRGLDGLLSSADGKNFIPGGTQRADERWGKSYISRLKGKIVDGVLTTEPGDVTIPYADTFDTNVDLTLKAARLSFKLTPTSAEGLIGAYLDVDEWYHQLATNWSTHHSAYGQMSNPSIMRALQRNADGYPDPKTGKNTAISAALEMKLVQAIILHHSTARAKTVAAAQ